MEAAQGHCEIPLIASLAGGGHGPVAGCFMRRLVIAWCQEEQTVVEARARRKEARVQGWRLAVGRERPGAAPGVLRSGGPALRGALPTQLNPGLRVNATGGPQ